MNNMNILFSASTLAFYDSGFNSQIPDDAIEITREEHTALLGGQSEGKNIVADENGYPALIDPSPAPPYVPQQVTNAQGAAALIQAGLWGDVLDYVDAMTDPTEKALAEVALHRTTHWTRTSPFLNAAATALGMSSEDLDNLFIQASEIEL